MNETDQITLMMEAFAEVVEEKRAQPVQLAGKLPSLNTVLNKLMPLPREALFLGVAEDGLPVLLNLYDSIPGPIFITGDVSSGKTQLLQMIARAGELLHAPQKARYAVITSYPVEWGGYKDSKSSVGIYNTADSASVELLQALVDWAHNNKGEGQSILLFIDDIEALIKLGGIAEQNLRWLLLRGTSRRVWTFVTLNANRAKDLEVWLDFFRTRLFGRIENIEDVKIVAGEAHEIFNHLTAGAEFAMREENNWLKFWMPSIEEERI